MSITAPNSYVTPASPVVVQQMARLNENADDLVRRAVQQISALQNISFANQALDPRLQFSQQDLDALMNQLGPLPEADLTDWTKGLDLSAGNQDFVFNAALLARLQEALPELILPVAPGAPPMPEAPADPGDEADPDRPVRPVLKDYEAPELDLNIPVPEYSDYTAEVPFPTLRPITLPQVPTLHLDDIKFEGNAPVFQGTPPDPADFQFEAQQYQSQLLDRAKTEVGNLLDGGNGVPAHIEDAIFERAREREAELADRQVQTAREEWAARGNRLPGGPLSRQTDRLRYEASQKMSQALRDQAVAHFQTQVEQYRLGLSSAIQLEDVAMRLFAQAEDRRLQAVQMKLQLTLAVFNAMISKYNADASVFQVQAQVYRDRLEGERAKLQVYSEQLRGQQIIGELNQQDVQIFAERLRALQINADIYRARVAGYEARFSAVRAQVDVYRAQLEANSSLVNVYEADTRAFGELVRAGTARSDRFNVKASIYSKQIDAWRAQYDGVLAGFNAQMEGVRMRRDVYASNTDRLQAWTSGEAGRIRALSDKYAAIAQELNSRSEAERTKYQMVLSIAEAALSRYKTANDILRENASLTIQSGLTAANLYVRAQETAAQTLSQLAAGFTSAANVNASISDSSGSSLSYNFSGELEVA